MSATKNAAAGAAAGSAFGPWGAAIGAGAGLLGSFLGVGSQRSTNKMNLKIMREQNAFNAKEAEKQRSWQQQMMNSYGTAQAQSAQYRAAGLNPQLANVSPQSVATGATAQASEAISQQAANYSGVGAAIQNGLQYYQQQQSVDNQKIVQDSVAALNETQGALNKALALQSNQKVEESKQTVANLKLAYDFSAKTLASRVRQQYMNETIQKWQANDIQYSSMLKSYELFNIAPQQVQILQSQVVYNYASAFRAAADGKLSLKELQYLPKKYAIMQTSALGSLLSGKAALVGAYATKELNHALAGESKARTFGINVDNKEKLAHWDWFSSSDDENLQYIKRDSRFSRLYDLNLRTNEATLNKILEEPELIRQMAGYYESGKWSNYGGMLGNFFGSYGYKNSMETYVDGDNGYTETTTRYDNKGRVTGSTEKTRSGGHSSRTQQTNQRKFKFKGKRK